MQEFFTAISNFGFPVVVAGYLLFRTEKKIEDLTATINELCKTLEKLELEINNLSNKRK